MGRDDRAGVKKGSFSTATNVLHRGIDVICLMSLLSRTKQPWEVEVTGEGSWSSNPKNLGNKVPAEGVVNDRTRTWALLCSVCWSRGGNELL